MASEPQPLGWLVVNVLESAGHDSDDAVVWDPDFKQGQARGERRRCSRRNGRSRALALIACLPLRAPDVPAVEIRGGARTIRVRAFAGPPDGCRTAAPPPRGDQLSLPACACPALQKLTSIQRVEDNGITWMEQLSL